MKCLIARWAAAAKRFRCWAWAAITSACQSDEQESIRIVRTAIDNGVNFMDNCWDYNGGTSEIRMGKALRDGYRQKVFLMTKIDGQVEGHRRAAD